MSKAEERALEVIPLKIDGDSRGSYDLNADKRIMYQLGYEQAEKDNELTWEDMMIIHKCCKDAMNLNLYAWETAEGQKKIYEDVLKRFKESKK